MNKIILLLLMFAWLFAAMASDNHKNKGIPPAVLSSLHAKYPDAGQPTWIIGTAGIFAARFYNQGAAYTARFNYKGEWLDEVKKVSFGDLRSNVRNAFSQSKFAAWHAYEVNAIQAKDKDVEYRILINNNNQKKYLFFDAKGQLKKETEILTM
ncbi:MAG: hypothetical protein JWQ78_1533 [Sediminibacterium sp.]|nr:hypothetical protein [Sediminibacterium sp.]